MRNTDTDAVFAAVAERSYTARMRYSEADFVCAEAVLEKLRKKRSDQREKQGLPARKR